MFLNLSSHPSRSWSLRQREAAGVLAGEVVDHPFPEVAPEADLAFVEALADEVVSALAMRPAVALVQGELTLTAALVARFQASGVPVVAPTTRRTVEELPDGRQAVGVEFVRFRFFPDLGKAG
jgi:hypothetical protein